MNCFFLIHSSFNVVNYFLLGLELGNLLFLCLMSVLTVNALSFELVMIDI